ncbi:S8 family peptidase [Deinococcus peraridilitoris]|uniref:Subtilisin-like serine protease n=1 Tax=Deinococcus peraridilitoris (strain DSM 19664 / LMG 22246 / CIP 109416 / KR-200) TaxID=937777 RepID=K9ZZA8_DEIPD|nr:S8 family peptidase [Deinococcus peraridilitoris]AFZ66931.1 subtilisin-like serine protease [Deinococcus peraridilitoris DSM 19664]
MPTRLSQIALLTFTLTACGTTQTSPTAPPTTSPGSISGVVTLTSAANIAAHPTPQALDLTQVIPGEFIIRIRNSGGSAPASINVEGYTLHAQRELTLDDTWLFSSPTASIERTEAILASLRARPDVLFADPNVRVSLTATPNDTYYKNQWHYPAINLPQAWDITTGTSTTVAVIDTGILYSDTTSGKRHPDLVNKVLPGYDFISDTTTANDGDGRDADAYDSGDETSGQSSYHGSHVAGTIAAATNNSKGVAGVSWNAKILPVRVLGVNGGDMTDVIDGILWSVGKAVKDVPANPNPAAIINLSLGATGSCPTSLQAALDAVNSTGAISVVAAGNENTDASKVFPANCKNVLTVGATNASTSRASYSNYGSPIDVMAPGGESTKGILSTWYDDTNKTYAYAAMAGTSMATPHVAGLVSLLKAQRPALTLADAEEVLRATATPLTATACNRPSGSDCGAGLVDAAKALTAAESTPTPPTTTAAKTFVQAVYMNGTSPDPVRSKILDLGTVSSSTPYVVPELPAGRYAVNVFTDLNGNAQLDAGEPNAKYPDLVTVESGQQEQGIDLSL